MVQGSESHGIASMSEPATFRVAAAQFSIGADIEANLATCLHWLDEAGRCRPDLVVLPEFCNHLSWYEDRRQCFEVSVRLDGPFLSAIAKKARQLDTHVVVNCTVQREDGGATGSSLLYNPQGQLILDNTKQVYIGHENDFLDPAHDEGRTVATRLGQIGLYACMDGVINETPRCLALDNAEILLNSLNSFALDEAALHVPVRAAENKVFVVAANKVGPLVPQDMLAAISQATDIPEHFLLGAGESQIIDPDGRILAKASTDRAEFIYADIEPRRANHKRRPDGTDIMRTRRPELYAPITREPRAKAAPVHSPKEVTAAILHPVCMDRSAAVTAALAAAVQAGAKLICLPPISLESGDLEQTASYAEQLVSEIADICADACVGTSIIRRVGDAFRYCAILINRDGILHEQPQVHRSARHFFSQIGDGFSACDTAWGRIAVVTSDDSLYPETFRLLALDGVQVAMVPLDPLEPWELKFGLLERSAENRINLLVATQSDTQGHGFITTLPTDFTIMTKWTRRVFDGLLSQPECTHALSGSEVTLASVRPANAFNKVVSRNTDLLDSRPWRLAGAISRPAGSA